MNTYDLLQPMIDEMFRPKKCIDPFFRGCEEDKKIGELCKGCWEELEGQDLND